MSSILKPFRATHFNTKAIKDLSKVVCPPYDVIDQKQLLKLRKKSVNNLSHILLADNGDYKKPKNLLNEWLQKQIMIDDDKESLYLYEQEFNIEEKSYNRYGILSLLKMDKNEIFPHERTLTAPKVDRKKMIKSVEANLSPIFVIAAKSSGYISEIYKRYCRKTPFLKAADHEGNLNKLWKIQDKKEINDICKVLGNSKLVIADGHHRFEISYDYFKKNGDKFKGLDYILAYVADCQKGLVILPTHRVITISDNKKIFFEKLEKYFIVKEVAQLNLDKNLKSSVEFCLGICREGKFYFLKLKDNALLNKITDKSYRKLDTYIFHKVVLSLFNNA
ncbi:MAG: DUF1015 domain-containing protein, partial [Candidatus Omnitrophica bacterium]|nr:DUF1015 domain-containing protein [Candidatus Omnitrophota bacterium]